jgi:membrane protease YdiL (CAAX protease family)
MVTEEDSGRGEARAASRDVRRSRDFPFYDGVPQLITGPQWWWILAASAAAFLFLLLWPLHGLWAHWVPVLVFPLLPLLVLRHVSPEHWTALFRRLGGRDVLVMFGVFVLNLAVTLGSGSVLKKYAGAGDNPAVEVLQDASPLERAMFFLQALPQLLGEELVTILPLLALMYYLHSRRGTSRRTALLVSWVVTALLFGALHLPTYEWNLVQAFLGIGLARLVLTLAYVITKNLWVSTGAHVLNDWAIFATAL